jgi:hypothetical protein
MFKSSWIVCGLIAGGIAVAAMASERVQSAAGQAPRVETIASLRAAGPAGLERALAAYDQLRQQEEMLTSRAAQSDNESLANGKGQSVKLVRQIASIEKAIDEIGGVRGCSVSRLYWYTNLEEAKAAAKQTARPILSLRMLGKLTDEYSCANSRFFRTALYSNKQVSDFMRTNFVLHWQSVRPVPKVTIDFGDGRKLERTLTGNSAHYVLTSDGVPLDVLPGLYSPLAFRQWMWDVCDFHHKYMAAAATDRAAMLQAFHRTRAENILRRWDLDIQQLGDQRTELVSSRITGAIETARLAGQEVPAAGPAPKAVVAARRAVGKTAAEAPMLRFANLGGTWIERGMDDDMWQFVANLHREDVKLDNASVAVIAREFPRAALAGERAESKRRQEDPVLRLARAFEDSMALDTVRNEYLLHRRIHETFVNDKTLAADVDALNEWVYAELFLTPSRDPWLGLAPNDVYTALDNDGRIDARAGGG